MAILSNQCGGYCCVPFFSTLRNNSRKENDMAKTDTYRVIVKNGDSKYVPDKKSGRYESKVVDYVVDFEGFAEALAEFITFVTDDYAEQKVSLVFKRGKK